MRKVHRITNTYSDSKKKKKKKSTCNVGDRVSILGQENSLEKEMATHSSILAWRIPRREEPGRPQSMGSQSQTGLSD